MDNQSVANNPPQYNPNDAPNVTTGPIDPTMQSRGSADVSQDAYVQAPVVTQPPGYSTPQNDPRTDQHAQTLTRYDSLLNDLKTRVEAIENTALSFAGVQHEGAVSTKVVTVRENNPRGGFQYHQIVLENSGFGHYRIANMGTGEKYYNDEKGARDGIVKAFGDGDIQFGTLNETTGEWTPDE